MLLLLLLRHQIVALSNGGGGALTSSTQTQTQTTKSKGSSSSSSSGGGGSAESKLQIRKALRSILTTQDEVWGIMNENSRLIEQFGQLAVASSSMEHNSAQILAEIDDTLGNYGP